MGEISIETEGPYAARLEIEPDGKGELAYEDLYSGQSGTTSYTLSADGSLKIGDLNVIVGPDGNVLTAVELASDDLSIHFGLRKSTGLDSSILNGDYVVGEFGDDGTPWVMHGLATADGAGTLSVTDFGGESFVKTYSVASDGTLSTGDTENPLRPEGLVSPNGDLFLSMTEGEGDGSLRVGIRKSTGMTTAMLNGTFMTSRISIMPGGEIVTSRSHWTFDGIGTWAFSTIQNSDGTSAADSMSYSVSSDGTLTIKDRPFGTVSPDGKLILWVGKDWYEGDSLIIAIKQPATYFPLQVGNKWIYTSFISGEYRTDEIIGSEMIDNNTTFIKQRIEAPTDGYIDYFWLGYGSSSVETYRIQSNMGLETPYDFSPPATLIPLEPEVGDKWTWGIPGMVTNECEVLSVTETVTVPAGTFSNCLSIKQTEQPVSGGTKERIYYYARGVGMVKLERPGHWTENLVFAGIGSMVYGVAP